MQADEKNMRKRLRVPAKAGLWYAASAIISKGISMVSTPVFTRLLSPEAFSVLPLFLSWLGLSGALSGTDGASTSTLGGLQKFSENRERFIKAALGFNLASVSLVCVLYFTLYPFFRNFSALGINLSLFLFIQLAFDSAIQLYLSFMRYKYEYKTVFLFNTLSSALSVTLSFLLIRLFGLSGAGRVFGLIISGGIFSGYALFMILRHGGRLYQAEIWKYLLKTNSAIIPQLLSSWLLLWADKLMISEFYGKGAMAKYSVAHSLGVAICFISAAASAALRPWILRKLSLGNFERIRQTVDLSLPLLSALALLVAAAAPELFGFLAAAEYADAAFAVIPIAFSVIPAFLSSIIATAMVHIGKSSRAVFPTLFAALLNIILNMLLFRFFHYTVAALTSLISSFISFALNLSAYKKCRGEKIFSAAKCSLFFAISFILGIGMFFIRDNFPLRAILALLIIAASLPRLKKALGILRE